MKCKEFPKTMSSNKNFLDEVAKRKSIPNFMNKINMPAKGSYSHNV